MIGALVFMMLFLSACSTSDRGNSNNHTNIFESVENLQSLTGEDVALLLTELNDVDYAEALQIVEHELHKELPFITRVSLIILPCHQMEPNMETGWS